MTRRISRFQDGGSLNNYITSLAEGIWKVHIFRHFRPHYLDVDTIFGDLGVNVYQS
jgi:hypothetical protein